MTQPTQGQAGNPFDPTRAQGIVSPVEVARFHGYDDVDSAPTAHHHSIGKTPNQVSPGDHIHDGVGSLPLPASSIGAHTHSESDVTQLVTDLNELFADMEPVGTLKMFAGDVAPSGYLLCDGTAISRTGTYAQLFGAIGTKYGAGDGTATFNLPNFVAKFPYGGNASGATGGATTHTHAVDAAATAASGAAVALKGQAANHLPPYITVLFIIKY